jgi:hypothetical protein
MATKKHAKRFNGEEESMVDQDAADQEATAMMKRGMEEGDRDEKTMPKQDFMSSKEPEAPAKSAPVMRKPAMPAARSMQSGPGRKPSPSTTELARGKKERYMAALTEGERGAAERRSGLGSAIADFFRPKSASEKDSASRSALRESEKAKPKAQMGFKERYASRNYASGGSVSASSRADGIATKGKTRGKIC